jgi:hypothetical protein
VTGFFNVRDLTATVRALLKLGLPIKRIEVAPGPRYIVETTAGEKPPCEVAPAANEWDAVLTPELPPENSAGNDDQKGG